jgi:hypothetical protein
MLRHHLITMMRGQSDRTMLAVDVMVAYGEMCAALRITPRPWNTVATILNRLTRVKGRPLKPYGYHIDHRGNKRRARVYFIPHMAKIEATT